MHEEERCAAQYHASKSYPEFQTSVYKRPTASLKWPNTFHLPLALHSSLPGRRLCSDLVLRGDRSGRWLEQGDQAVHLTHVQPGKVVCPSCCWRWVSGEWRRPSQTYVLLIALSTVLMPRFREKIAETISLLDWSPGPKELHLYTRWVARSCTEFLFVLIVCSVTIHVHVVKKSCCGVKRVINPYIPFIIFWKLYIKCFDSARYWRTC
jgi:hypothetical protein